MSGDEDEQSRVLASVRRILGEDAARAEAGEPKGDVFQLDPSMMIEPSAPAGASPAAPPPGPVAGAAPAPAEPHPQEDPRARSVPPADEPAAPAAREPSGARPHQPAEADTTSLIAGRAAEATGNAFGSLRHALREQQRGAIASHRGGPSIEELIREELRPLLRAWVDEHLPSVVERVIQAEISRIAARDEG